MTITVAAATVVNTSVWDGDVDRDVRLLQLQSQDQRAKDRRGDDRIILPRQQRQQQRQRQRQRRRAEGGVVDGVLEWVVRGVLTGAQVVVVVAWVASKVAQVLEFVVELGLFILQSPN